MPFSISQSLASPACTRSMHAGTPLGQAFGCGGSIAPTTQRAAHGTTSSIEHPNYFQVKHANSLTKPPSGAPALSPGAVLPPRVDAVPSGPGAAPAGGLLHQVPLRWLPVRRAGGNLECFWDTRVHAWHTARPLSSLWHSLSPLALGGQGAELGLQRGPGYQEKSSAAARLARELCDGSHNRRVECARLAAHPEHSAQGGALRCRSQPCCCCWTGPWRSSPLHLLWI
jgi:hypothetical protein